jgi:hypothetical protein
VKWWQIFAVGAAGLLGVLLFPAYESLLAGLAAVAVVVLVIAGFSLRPRRDIFYLRTTANHRFDQELFSEHDCLAIRIEVTRLWILFVPTFLALAFLVATAARGMMWRVDLVRSVELLIESGWVNYIFFRAGLFVAGLMVGVLSLWFSERRVLRDADATSIRSLSAANGYLSYMFLNRSGEYYGGEGVALFSVKDPQLRSLVFYCIGNPELNKLLVSFLFHRAVVIGRGITDLDYQSANRSVLPVPTSS